MVIDTAKTFVRLNSHAKDEFVNLIEYITNQFPNREHDLSQFLGDDDIGIIPLAFPVKVSCKHLKTKLTHETTR